MPRSLFQSMPVMTGAGVIRTCRVPGTCGPGKRGKGLYRRDAGVLECVRKLKNKNGKEYCRRYKLNGKKAPKRLSMSAKNVAARARRAAKAEDSARSDRQAARHAMGILSKSERRAAPARSSVAPGLASAVADEARARARARQQARAAVAAAASGSGVYASPAMMMPLGGAYSGGAYSGGAYSGGAYSVGAGRPCTVYRRGVGAMACAPCAPAHMRCPL